MANQAGGEQEQAARVLDDIAGRLGRSPRNGLDPMSRLEADLADAAWLWRRLREELDEIGAGLRELRLIPEAREAVNLLLERHPVLRG